MKLSTRIATAIFVLVMVTTILTLVIIRQIVDPPISKAQRAAWVQSVHEIGQQVDANTDLEALGQPANMEIHEFRRRIPRHWRRVPFHDATLHVAPGRRRMAVYKGPAGSFSFHSPPDLTARFRRVPPFLLFTSLLIGLAAFFIARLGLRPLQRTTVAMRQMADGDLELRLPIEGPAELDDAYRAFNQMADRMTDRLRSERQVLAGISHELRTPLTRLRLETELLRDAGVEERRLERMERSLSALDALIAEALDLSRLQLGSAPLHRRPTALERVAQDCDADEVLGSATLHVDPGLVRRAMSNLVQNARKYAPDSRIEVEVDSTGFSVRDHGPGVGEDQLEAIFEPFHRTETGQRTASGVGLGLMLVRAIAEGHGGSARAENAHPGLRVRVDLGDSTTARSSSGRLEGQR